MYIFPDIHETTAMMLVLARRSFPLSSNRAFAHQPPVSQPPFSMGLEEKAAADKAAAFESLKEEHERKIRYTGGRETIR